MKKFKKPLHFSLALVPLTVIASLLTFFYSYGISKEILDAAAARMGSMGLFILAGVLQTVILTFAACFFGFLLSRKLGLSMGLQFEKQPLLKAAFLGLIMGLLMLIDCFTFGKVYPDILDVNRQGQTLTGIAAGVVYGGIIEELLMRLFFMSFLSWAVWKLFARNTLTVPQWALMTGNLLSALLFAAGHLPATLSFFGTLTPILFVRCLLLNGIGGIFFGHLFRRNGLQYAMVCHMCSHIFFKLLFSIFF